MHIDVLNIFHVERNDFLTSTTLDTENSYGTF